MKPVDAVTAVNAILKLYKDLPWELHETDCGTLVRDYVYLRTGKVHQTTHLDEPDLKTLKGYLGPPKKTEPAYGDVFLTKDYLGIYLGYCQLLMIEELGLVRMGIPKGKEPEGIYWEVGNG